MAGMTTSGRVREWNAEGGWGVIDAPEAPGGGWAAYSSVLVAGFRALEPGHDVELVFGAPEQGGYPFRAVEVWPAGATPFHTQAEPMGPPFSTLHITWAPQ